MISSKRARRIVVRKFRIHVPTWFGWHAKKKYTKHKETRETRKNVHAAGLALKDCVKQSTTQRRQ
ncbi:hypothetical protein BDW62DRAFT_184241 [Aspergillus aurantiobrunneus]